MDRIWILPGLSCSYKQIKDGSRFPQDLDYLSGYFGEELTWGNWGVQQIELVDNYAVLSSPKLIILDIADSNAIRQVGQHDTTWENVDDMVVQDGHVFLTSKSHGLEIFDISDLANPASIGVYPYQNDRPTSITVADDYVYLYASQPYTRPLAQPGWEFNEPYWLVLDVSDPKSIQLIREVNDLAEPMAVTGNYIFAAGRWSKGDNQTGTKLQVIDITDKTNPIVVWVGF